MSELTETSVIDFVESSFGLRLDKVKCLTERQGIYFLFRSGVLVYIGSSVDILSRVKAHSGSHLKFDTAYYLLFSNIDLNELVDLEYHFIRYFQPISNRSRRSGMGRISIEMLSDKIQMALNGSALSEVGNIGKESQLKPYHQGGESHVDSIAKLHPEIVQKIKEELSPELAEMERKYLEALEINKRLRRKNKELFQTVCDLKTKMSKIAKQALPLLK